MFVKLLPPIDSLCIENNSKNIFKSVIDKFFTKIFEQTQFTPPLSLHHFATTIGIRAKALIFFVGHPIQEKIYDGKPCAPPRRTFNSPASIF